MTDAPGAPSPGKIRTFLRHFFQGASAPVRGLKYLMKKPALWPYAIWPMVISLLVTLAVLAGLVLAAWWILPWLHQRPYFATAPLALVQLILADILIVALLLALAAGTYLLANGILTGWFNERLARQVELLLGTPAEQLREASFKYQVVDACVDFAVVGGTALGCVLIGCVPVVGAVAGPVLNFYVDWFVMGYDYLEIPMALRGMRRNDKRAFAKRHRGQVLGLGSFIFVLNLVPVIGNILTTTAAVGAVLLYRDLRADKTPAASALAATPA